MWNDYSVVVEEVQMDYAVVLYMNEEKTAMVKEWIKELAPVCGSDYCLCTEPHITISAIIADDEELVKKEAAELSKVLKKGEIKVGVIGVFNPFVLFLSPVVDDYLIESSQIANDLIKNYVLTTTHGQDMPHFARLCHLARFSVK